MNSVCKALGIKYPVIQGSMAWTATSSLAAAVSNAGGLGTLGVGFAPENVIREEIRKTRELTDKPFAANIFMIPEMLKVNHPIFMEEKPPVVYVDVLANLDFDLAHEHFTQWHEAGMKIVYKASFISDAVKAEKAGADVVIVKGWEGGGHVTDETTMVLVPQAADLLHCPLVGSGGVADGRGMAACIALGAQGIEMGSAFLLAEECAVHEAFKQEIIKTGDMSTDITGLTTGEPCRQIRNPLSEKILKIEAEHVRKEAAELMLPLTTGSLRKAAMEGDLVNGAIMIGQNVPLLKKVRPAKEIIESIVAECEAILSRPVSLDSI